MACAGVATVKARAATAINLIIGFLPFIMMHSLFGEPNQVSSPLGTLPVNFLLEGAIVGANPQRWCCLADARFFPASRPRASAAQRASNQPL